MRQHQSSRLRAALVAVAIIVVLALLANPELRALLLLVDSLGLELVALLLATQLKDLAYASLPAANAIMGRLCTLAFNIGNGAMRAYPKTLPWRPFDKLFGPALVFATYGIRCRAANRGGTWTQI
jgi:hypothetical protein